MKQKEDLFHLIQAMSKSEKRYFTLDAQKSGRKPSKYLELFQAINEMEEAYYEEKLRKKFGKNLPYDKSYLYEAILRSMRDYRSSKSKAARIRELLLDAKYLYERGLYLQCEERLQDAKQVADTLGDQLALLEINKEMRNIAWDLKRRTFREEMQNLILEKEEYLKAVEEEFRYLDLLCELLLKNIKGASNSETEPDSMLEEKHIPESTHARRRFFQSAALAHQMEGQPEQTFEYYQKVVDWWNENEAFRQEEFHRYVIDLSNYLHACYTNQKLEYLPKVLDQLEKDKPKNFHSQRIVFQKVSTYKLIYHINLGIADGVESLVEKIEKGIQKYQLNLVTQTVLTFNTGVLLFVLEKFKACEYWLLKIIKGTKMVERKDIRTGAYLLHLIVTFELGSLDELESTYRSTYRYLSREVQAPQGSFERTLASAVKRLMDAPPSQEKDILQRLREKIRMIKEDPNQQVPLGLDDLAELWASSRLENRKLASIMKQG